MGVKVRRRRILFGFAATAVAGVIACSSSTEGGSRGTGPRGNEPSSATTPESDVYVPSQAADGAVEELPDATSVPVFDAYVPPSGPVCAKTTIDDGALAETCLSVGTACGTACGAFYYACIRDGGAVASRPVTPDGPLDGCFGLASIVTCCPTLACSRASSSGLDPYCASKGQGLKAFYCAPSATAPSRCIPLSSGSPYVCC